MKQLYSNGKFAFCLIVIACGIIFGLLALTYYGLSHWRWSYSSPETPAAPGWVDPTFYFSFYFIPLLFLTSFIVGLLSVRHKSPTARFGQLAMNISFLPVSVMFVSAVFAVLSFFVD